MKIPGYQRILVSLLGATLFVALLAGLRADPPDKSANKGRTRPQIIYHVRPTSNYAATLHSQEKTQSNEVPSDSNASPSIQPSRANADAVEPRVQQETAPKQQRQHSAGQKSQFSRPPNPGKSKGHGPKGKH